MTKTECCGPPGTIFREDVASEVHPDQAPEMTRACYTSFDYYNCKANCCEGDHTICVPNEMGGFCNLENGTDFYFDDGGNKQLITDDYWDDLHSARDNRELIEARDDYRNRYIRSNRNTNNRNTDENRHITSPLVTMIASMGIAIGIIVIILSTLILLMKSKIIKL